MYLFVLAFLIFVNLSLSWLMLFLISSPPRGSVFDVFIDLFWVVLETAFYCAFIGFCVLSLAAFLFALCLGRFSPRASDMFVDLVGWVLG